MVLQCGRRDGNAFSSAPKEPKGCTSLCFCTWYFQANQTPDFAPEYSCIESINAFYEAKLESKKRSRGVEEYQKALKETRRVSREEPRAAKGRQAARKRSQGSTSTVEPAPKKVRRDLAPQFLRPKTSLLVLRNRGKKRKMRMTPP